MKRINQRMLLLLTIGILIGSGCDKDEERRLADLRDLNDWTEDWFVDPPALPFKEEADHDEDQ